MNVNAIGANPYPTKKQKQQPKPIVFKAKKQDAQTFKGEKVKKGKSLAMLGLGILLFITGAVGGLKSGR